MHPRTIVFVGGLHRSGTTLLGRCLAAHPAVTGFVDTGVPADEGQHLQTVYPPAKAHGGPGRFAFDPAAHLTESSSLVSPESRARLLAEWGRWWDASKPVAVEKSPPNLIRARFLQALFPEATFVMVLRHPVAVAYATIKWRGTIPSLLHHWTVAHERFAADRAHLQRLHVVRYEDLVADTEATLEAVYAFVGLDPVPPGVEVRPGYNDAYFDRWRNDRRRVPSGLSLRLAEARLERRVRPFGYSFRRDGRRPEIGITPGV